MTSQELAHRGNAATPGIDCSGRRQDIDASAKQSEGSRRNQQTGQRQRKHLRLGSHQYVVLLAATLLVCRSESLLLGAIGDVPHGELGDSSLLTRVKAVKETARAVGSAADRWTGKVKQTLHIKETQVTMHATKKPTHGGVPSWFSRAISDPKPHGGRSQLEGNRRMLRRQKQHHHSVEDEWLKCHRRHVKELEESEASATAGWDVLFYGDSIMEEWRGTFLGSAWGPFQDVKKVWAEFFESKPYKSHALGIAGDKSEQLLWRLQNGEIPASKHPKVVVVMIGTNDLVGNCTAKSAQETARSIMDINTVLHAELPSAHIVSLAILPKGETWPNRCSDAILSVNAELQEHAEMNPEFAHYVDMGSAFLSDEPVGGKYDVKEALMPDSLHPSAIGMRIVASQLEPIVRNLVSTPVDLDADTSAMS